MGDSTGSCPKKKSHLGGQGGREESEGEEGEGSGEGGRHGVVGLERGGQSVGTTGTVVIGGKRSVPSPQARASLLRRRFLVASFPRFLVPWRSKKTDTVRELAFPDVHVARAYRFNSNMLFNIDYVIIIPNPSFSLSSLSLSSSLFPSPFFSALGVHPMNKFSGVSLLWRGFFGLRTWNSSLLASFLAPHP